MNFEQRKKNPKRIETVKEGRMTCAPCNSKKKLDDLGGLILFGVNIVLVHA